MSSEQILADPLPDGKPDLLIDKLHSHFAANTGFLTLVAAIGGHCLKLIADVHLQPQSSLRIVLDTYDAFLILPALAGGIAAYVGKSPRAPKDSNVAVAPDKTP